MFPETRTEDPNRRYTTASFMAWIKQRAGVDAWDLDVAADAESHHAPRWFSLLSYEGSAGLDGLAQSWLPTAEWFEGIDARRRRLLSEQGHQPLGRYIDTRVASRTWRVFCNPPFDDLGSWVSHAWSNVEAASNREELYVRIGFVLPGNRHEQPFWQEMIEPFRRETNHMRRFGYELSCHFPPGRQSYAKPGSNGVAVGSAEWPSALLVWRST